MPLFNTYQLVIILGLVNGIILLITLSGLPSKFRRPTRYLGLFVLGYSFYVCDWTIIPSITHYYKVPPFWVPSLYFLPALAYFFTQSLTKGHSQFSFRDKLFLIPGILDTIYQLFKWIKALVEGRGYYFPLDDRTEFFIYEGIGILFSAFCFYNIYQIASKANFKKSAAFRFYQFAFYFLLFVLFLWMGLYLVDYFKPSLLSFELQFIFWLMDLSCFFFLGYRNLMAPNKYSVKLPTNPEPGSGSGELLDVLQEKQLFLNPELKRKDLAEVIGVSEEKISGILNNELEVSFYELINKLRAEAAKKLLDEGATNTLTMEAIASRSGFKSKTTFYKFFKGQFGVQPGDYVKEVAKVVD